MKTLGRLAYIIILPALRVYLSRTSRAYVIVQAEGQVLVLKSWLSRQQWQLPGGGQRRSELVAQAAVRELAEELNIKIEVSALQLLTKGTWKTDRLNYPYQIFTAKLAGPLPIQAHRPEILNAQWLPIAELTPANTVPEVLAALQSVKIDKRAKKSA